MTLVPITLPPGMYKNATPYAAKNRYSDGNLVRWHNGSARAIGGWKFTVDALGVQVLDLGPDPAVETGRDGIAWSDNANKLNHVFGTNLGLYHLSDLSVVTNITPAGFTGGPNNPTVNTGYGKGAYGAGLYGSPREPAAGATPSLFRWSFAVWGEDLVASYADTNFRGPVFAWSPGDPVAVQIPNAPIDVNGVEVTSQRIVMTIGSNADSRLVQWSDREDREDWTPEINNYAGSQSLPGTGALVSIKNVLNQTFILSETTAYVARFIGAPFVFGFDEVGTDCGPLHPGGVQVTDRFAMWLGRRRFWKYDGTVAPVACDVMDFLADDMNVDNIAKLSSGTIPQYNEVWWLYQSKTSTGDVDSYVTYDYVEGHWTTGRLDRSLLVSSRGIRAPIMASPIDGKLYDHEIPSAAVDGSFLETGPLEFGEGDKNMAVRYIFPDTQTRGKTSFTLLGKAMPNDPEYTYGPYAFDTPIATRAMGREIRLRVDGLALGWELGPASRFDVAPVGTGMR